MLHYIPSRIEISNLGFYARKSQMDKYDITIGFTHNETTVFNSEMKLSEARELANKILAICDAEPLTPIVEFQDSTINDK